MNGSVEEGGAKNRWAGKRTKRNGKNQKPPAGESVFTKRKLRKTMLKTGPLWFMFYLFQRGQKPCQKK